jgi:hypothetical protein
MSAKSISMCQGKGSIAHNNREYFCKNVDPERTKKNIIYKQQPIAEAYQECFGKAQARYNEKQKRADRQIDCYFENLFGVDPKTQKAKSTLTAPSKQMCFYEDLVQIGTKDDTPEEKAVHAAALDEYMRGFQDRNPQFHVFNAVLHRDEATPHGHTNWIPVATGYKNGLDTQNGLAKALEQMGHGTGKHAIDRWRQSERKVLEDICTARGIEIKPPEKSRGSFSVEEYKNEKDDMRTKIHAELEPERAEIASKVTESKNKVGELKKEVETLEDKIKLSAGILEAVEAKQAQIAELDAELELKRGKVQKKREILELIENPRKLILSKENRQAVRDYINATPRAKAEQELKDMAEERDTAVKDLAERKKVIAAKNNTITEQKSTIAELQAKVPDPNGFLGQIANRSLAYQRIALEAVERAEKKARKNNTVAAYNAGRKEMDRTDEKVTETPAPVKEKGNDGIEL